jgi:hypothetical protein
VGGGVCEPSGSAGYAACQLSCTYKYEGSMAKQEGLMVDLRGHAACQLCCTMLSCEGEPRRLSG